MGRDGVGRQARRRYYGQSVLRRGRVVFLLVQPTAQFLRSLSLRGGPGERRLGSNGTGNAGTCALGARIRWFSPLCSCSGTTGGSAATTKVGGRAFFT